MDVAKDILIGLRALNAKERPNIGLSEIGRCIRQLWYKTHQAEAASVRDLDSELVFEWGHAFERLVVAALLQAGYDLRHTGDDQLSVTLGSISGHLDGVLHLPNGKRFVVECKSMSGYGFMLTTREGVEAAQPEYHLQCQAYATAIGADGILFIAGNKENRKKKDTAWDDVQSLYVEWLAVDSGPAIARVAEVEAALAEAEPPARPYAKPVKFPCNYCDFESHCWGTAEAPTIPGMDE